MLFVLASALGLLSFFEPCTIATHTLFSARAHAQPRAVCGRALFELVLTRTLLLVVIVPSVVLWASPAAPGPWLAAGVLALMASVYVISRLVYLPVPHVELWRLWPGGQRFASGVKLGLTLPACTLPLFVIAVVAAVVVGSPVAGAAAGALFAIFFTLPSAVLAFVGFTAASQRLLSHSARATSYLTAALLYGGAVYVLV
jgi:cytochrome c-type biogenesis protein